MAREFLMQFPNMVFSTGQELVFEYAQQKRGPAGEPGKPVGYTLKLTVKRMEGANLNSPPEEVGRVGGGGKGELAINPSALADFAGPAQSECRGRVRPTRELPDEPDRTQQRVRVGRGRGGTVSLHFQICKRVTIINVQFLLSKSGLNSSLYPFPPLSPPSTTSANPPIVL